MMTFFRVFVVVLWCSVLLTAQTPSSSIPYVTPDTPFGTGAYKAIMEVDPSLPTHTVYRPAKLAALGSKKLPIIAWGNGACVNVGNRFRQFLTEIASHGYLVIAIGPIGPKEMEAAPQPVPPPKPGEAVAAPRPPTGPPATTASQLIDAINWAIKENTRQGSPYFGRLDTKNIGAMGQSCGGVQAIKASADPCITMTISWNSGLLPTPHPGMENVSKEALANLHAPIAYFNGDPSDIAHNNGKDDFERVNNLPVLFAWCNGVGHSGTYREANGGEFGKVAVAYLNWRLKGDKNAAKMFKGADCGLCPDANWKIFKKKID